MTKEERLEHWTEVCAKAPAEAAKVIVAQEKRIKELEHELEMQWQDATRGK